MKTIPFFAAIFCLLFAMASCQDDAQTDSREELVGVWKLTRITGGFAGTGYPADFTHIEFKDNGTYRINNQDELKGEGSYSLTNNDKLIVKFVPADSMRISFEEYAKEVTFDKDNLILSDPCCDLFQYEFGEDGN